MTVILIGFHLSTCYYNFNAQKTSSERYDRLNVQNTMKRSTITQCAADNDNGHDVSGTPVQTKLTTIVAQVDNG